MTRVFMVACPSLFVMGLERLLREQTELNLVGREADPERALDRIRVFEPDTVVVVDDESVGDPALWIGRVLKQGATHRVVEIQLDENTLTLYHVEKRRMRQVEHLVEVIRVEQATAPTPSS